MRWLLDPAEIVRFRAVDYQPDHRASTRDASMLGVLNQIKEYAELDPTSEAFAEPKILGPGLNGYERAMAHQYCDELQLTHRGFGPDGMKIGRPDNISFDDQVQLNMEERNTIIQEDKVVSDTQKK